MFGNVNRQVDHAVKFIFKKVSTSRETIVVLSSHFKERRMRFLFTIAYVNARNIKFLESLAQKWILVFIRIVWIGKHFILIRILKLFVSRINEYAIFLFNFIPFSRMCSFFPFRSDINTKKRFTHLTGVIHVHTDKIQTKITLTSDWSNQKWTKTLQIPVRQRYKCWFKIGSSKS